MSARAADGSRSAGAAAVAVPLDLLLADGALGPARRLLPGGAGVRFAAALARRPHRVAHRATVLAGELARAGLGRSTATALPTDRRFSDPSWTANPVLRRLVQAYLAAGQSAEALVADADWAGVTPSSCGC
jgi:poly[(R)-3-hydroxyalkanoate] polymerase subunit PhaC